LAEVGEAGEFPSPQQPLLSADEKTLFVADYRLGIVAIDLKSKKLNWLRPGPGLIVNGIDGLYLSGKSFIAIQNGMKPNGKFCFLANTGWDAFGEDGQKKSGVAEVVTSIYCRSLP